MTIGWIWISRWQEFQHYKHDRGKVPAWIKQYTRQLDDDRYLDLAAGERALLSDLRAEFARARSELKADRKRLSNRIGTTVYQRQLDRLVDAGFIEIISRDVLEKRLEHLYGGSSPEVEEEEEGDREEEKPFPTQPVDLHDAPDQDDIDFVRNGRNALTDVPA